MRGQRGLAVAFSILAMVPAPARPQEKTVSGAILRLAVDPGKAHRFLHVVEAEFELMPGRQKLVRRETEFSIRILRQTAAGGFDAEVRFGRAREIGRKLADGKEVPGSEETIDSQAPLPEEEVERLDALRVIAMASSTLPMDLDRGGRVSQVRGVDEAVRARRASLGLKGAGAALLSHHLDASTIAEFVDAALVATPLPSEAVVVGSRWEDEDTVPWTTWEVPRVLRQELSVESIDPREVVLKGVGRIDAITIGGRKPPVKSKLTGPMESKLRLSRVDGLLLESEAKHSIRVLTMIRTTSTTRRVESWPSESKPAQEPPGGGK